MTASDPKAAPTLEALALQIKDLDASASLEDIFALIDPKQSRSTSPVESSAANPSGRLEALADTPWAIHAAISDTFLVEELTILPSSANAAAISDTDLSLLLAHSETTVVGEVPRLRLSPQGRAVILRNALRNPRYKQQLAAEHARDVVDHDAIGRDPIRVTSAWLRCYLVGSYGSIFQAPLFEVRAALAALEALELVRDILPPDTPTIETARRRLQFAELLEPLRILIGSEGGWDGSTARDRYVGRADELRTLRSFVGELASESVSESISRGFAGSARWALARLSRTRPEVLMVEAQGGLGKTSLIAKFVLDHVYGHRSNDFLFAYLDFDRAGLQARDPALLLLEVVRQVSLQTGGADFIELHNSIRSELNGGLQQSRDQFEQFRTLLGNWSSSSGSPFLLVLDTLEVAQFDPLAVAGIDAFLTRLTTFPSGMPTFAALRVVGAGRASLGNMGFVKTTEKLHALRLRPLSITDARLMANALGVARLGGAWRSEWSERIAGRSSDGGDRREPLSIRVATDLLLSTDHAQRETLSREMAASGERADESFVGRLYADRVLRHIRNEEVRKLAWPGLILRNISITIARDVLAEPCGLSITEIDRTLDELAREIWMVEPVQIAGRPMLRHRRELRARTLPLMQRQNPALFETVNERALGYFAERRKDPFARGEWIYHRLLGGEQPRTVDADWKPELVAFLGDAAADFPRGSDANLYLLARTATSMQARTTVAKMPDWIVFEHAGRAGLSLTRFDDSRLLGSVFDLSTRLVVATQSPAAETARATLLIKAGRWGEVEEPDEIPPSWFAAWRFADSYRAARALATGARRFPISDKALAAADCGWLAQTLAASRLHGGVDSPEAIDAMLFDVLEDPDVRLDDLDSPSLRVAALFGNLSCRPAARLWATQHYLQQPLDGITFSGNELRILAETGLLAQVRKQATKQVQSWLDIALRSTQPMRFRNVELAASLRTLLDQLMVNPNPGIERLIRRFISLRQDDWIVPLAYAVARAASNLATRDFKPLAERVRGYQPHRSLLSSDAAEDLWDPARKDFLALLRFADEASDLHGMVRSVLALVPQGRYREELEGLAHLLRQWTNHIALRVVPDERSDVGGRSKLSVSVSENPNDPHKGRWGRQAERNGRRLYATLTDVSRNGFAVDLTVESTDGTPLRPRVSFHLHPSFPRSVITIRKIREGRMATIFDVRAYGAFTLGAEVLDGQGNWIKLEYDLVDLPELPSRFHDR